MTVPQPGEPGDAPESGAPESGAPEAREGGATGHPTVDAALASLDDAAALPPEAQVTAYEQAHRALRDTLSTILVPAPSNQPAKPNQPTKPGNPT